MLIREYDLKCDGCGKRYLMSHGSTKTLRQWAKKRGWTRMVGSHRGSRDGLDLCPACSIKEVSHNEVGKMDAVLSDDAPSA